MRTAAFGAVLLLVGLTGCGGDSKASNTRDAQSAGAESASESTTTTVAGSKAAKPKAGKDKAAGASSTTTTTAKGAAPGSKAAETTPTTDPFAMTMDIKAELATECVRPGGSQTITIRAPYGAGVGYDVAYADGLTSMGEGHYGGNMGGYTDPEGTFVHTFVVAPNAPTGPAVANVLGTHIDHGFGETHAYFAVADALGKCDPADLQHD